MDDLVTVGELTKIYDDMFQQHRTWDRALVLQATARALAFAYKKFGDAKIDERQRAMADWLRDNAPEAFEDQKHLDTGTTERAYWHLGYVAACRDVRRLLSQ